MTRPAMPPAWAWPAATLVAGVVVMVMLFHAPGLEWSRANPIGEPATCHCPQPLDPYADPDDVLDLLIPPDEFDEE
jgi:hypothetical protein